VASNASADHRGFRVCQMSVRGRSTNTGAVLLRTGRRSTFHVQRRVLGSAVARPCPSVRFQSVAIPSSILSVVFAPNVPSSGTPAIRPLSPLNAPHEGRTAALSPGVPLDAVVVPRYRAGRGSGEGHRRLPDNIHVARMVEKVGQFAFFSG